MKDNVSKSNLKKIPFIIIMVMILLVGGTYAWYTLTLRGTKTVRLHAGTLSIELDEELSEGIHLSNTYPMTDEEGMATKEYHFTIKNDGNIPSNYVVNLNDLDLTEGKNRMNDEAVKFNLSKTKYNDDKTIKENETNTKKLLSLTGANPNRVLDSGLLQPNEYNEYTLRVWMDYDAGNEEQGAIFKAQVKVESTQVQE